MDNNDEPRYPDIRVKLVGTDGNAFAILTKVRTALIRAEVTDAEIQLFIDEAMAGDYDHLLRTCVEWVDVH